MFPLCDIQRDVSFSIGIEGRSPTRDVRFIKGTTKSPQSTSGGPAASN